MKKRLGIFCTYDPEGIVDDYVFFLLQEAKKVLTHLAIICNGKLKPKYKQRLEEISADLVVRDNVGFDMEAWRQGIFQKNLSDYDELILFNDSFYGPFYPFAEIFYEMDTKKVEADFWGITVHGKTEDPDKICPYGYIPEHVQSYFLVIREKMLHSKQFFDYWKNAEVAKTFDEAVKKHEVCFTKYFADMDFKYAAYCDTRGDEEEFKIKVNPYVFFTEKILKEQHCPIIKKRVFYFTRERFLTETYGTVPRDCLNFLRENTNYDVSLIIKNLLRKFNVATIKSDLGLDYIVSSTNPNSKKINFSNAVIVANLNYEELIPKCVKYLANIPKDILLVITVSTETKKDIVEKLLSVMNRPCEIRISTPPSTDLSALYIDCADLFEKFKYLCFIHDVKSHVEDGSIIQGAESFYLFWENLLNNKTFIENTLAILEEDQNLGILASTPPYHGYFNKLFFYEHFWGNGVFFEKTLKLAKKLNIPKKFFNTHIPPLTIGNVFWCRTAALKKITEHTWKAEDFVLKTNRNKFSNAYALERIISFAAQNEGFYTGWIMTEEFAKNGLENFIYFAMGPYEISSSDVPINYLRMEPLVSKYLSNVTTIQGFKILMKPRCPEPIWKMLQTLNNICGKFGFRV